MANETTNEVFEQFNVKEFNGETEEGTYGPLGSPSRLLPGLAESLLKLCDDPDVVIRRMLRDDEGTWNVDYGLTVEVYYPGNSRQTMFVAVETARDCDGNDAVDYYQMPYCELVPRCKMVLESRESTDERWIISQINNEQLRGWFNESGVTRMSNQAQKLLRENKQNEIIRNKHGGDMESRPESADD